MADDFLRRRGWRNFAAIPLPRATVRVSIGGDTIEVEADRGGYIDVRVKNAGLGAGWHEVTLQSAESRPAQAPVQVVADDQTFGLISDIDDTVISTWLPRMLIAAWNSFVVTEQARQSVPGMARMYQQVLAEHPGAPTIYVSTGAWNTYPFLRRFLKRHGYPQGTMLLTDWGPTNTGWFRSGPDHKRRSLHELARDLPQVRWLLIGDDGQHDPMLYREFADLQPDHVRAIAIRQLTMAQQVLAHGTTTVLGDPNHVHWTPHTVPEVRGPDGDALAPKVKAMLGGQALDERPAS
ncbi:App1 family protein [Aestuariimicrobium sp. Y1814]|uniref:App1 family protein n=1 Tax=Aestuariimicrobium sp. Y1814 TaxID=3418742 RepID=UPI003DA730F9